MRAEFSKSTKEKAFKRAEGKCEDCDVKLSTGYIEYHHDKECTFGGDNHIGNCVVLCRACHSKITRSQAKVIAKSNRTRAKHIGAKRRGRGFPTNKNGRFKMKMDGTIERRR